MRISELFTREECNKPQSLKIGSESMEILGTDSDAFRKAKLEAQRKVASGELEMADFEPWLVAHLIVSWTYEDDCSFDNKFSLCKNTPSLCEAIDRAASKRANFIKPQSGGSVSGQKGSSGSTSRRQKARK